LPIKFFVINNQGYVSIRNTQSNLFDKIFVGSNKTSGLSLPNIKKQAYAYNISYYDIVNNTDMDLKLTNILSAKEQSIC